MRYKTVMTSKGTITIAAPLRKALGLTPGQEISLELDAISNRVVMETGVTIEEFEKVRDEILSRYPRRKPLSGKELKDAIAKAWVSGHR
jgi:bifunctional DNA-binding transcriptional regulator/antitoxin component of YhaV-PrlF toxin-antitoxin module